MGAKKHASIALARLAVSGHETQAAIAAAGAIAPLLLWLKAGAKAEANLPDLAGRALDLLAQGNEATTIAIIQVGAIPPLVAMLRPDDWPTGRVAEAQKAAAGLLATLAQVTTKTCKSSEEASDPAANYTDDDDATAATAADALGSAIDGAGGEEVVPHPADEQAATPAELSPQSTAHSVGADLIAEAGGIPFLIKLLLNTDVHA